jgi:hypothetical protein
MMYSPADVEIATSGDITPDVLRDWRRRGLLEGMGRMEKSGRWRYDRASVCSLAIASYLADQGLKIERAIIIAGTARNAVIAWLAKEPTEFYNQMKDRYPLVVAFEGAGGFQALPFRDPSRLPRLENGIFHVVNPRFVAEALPKLRHWYNAEREAAKRD